jgi:hypothetical protein
MKIEFEIPDKRYGEAVKVLADAWHNGDANQLAKEEFLTCLATDLDNASEQGHIDDATHRRLLDLVDPTWPKPATIEAGKT